MSSGFLLFFLNSARRFTEKTNDGYDRYDMRIDKLFSYVREKGVLCRKRSLLFFSTFFCISCQADIKWQCYMLY